jgi:hypothetical protein
VFAWSASKGTTGSALHGLILAGGDHRERCRSHPNISDGAAVRSSVSRYSRLAVPRAPMPERGRAPDLEPNSSVAQSPYCPRSGRSSSLV